MQRHLGHLFSLIAVAMLVTVFAVPVQAHGAAAAAAAQSATGSPAPAATPTPAPRPTAPGTPGGTTGAGPAGTGTGPGGEGGGSSASYGPKKMAGGAGRYPTRWGQTKRSPSVVDALDIHWIDAEWPVKHDANYGARIQPLYTLLHDRCFDPNCSDLHCKDFKCHDVECMKDKKLGLVYLYDPMAKRETKTELEMEWFGADEMAAMTNFVHCFSMAAESVERQQFESEFAGELPALVFLAPNGERLGLLTGSSITRRRIEAQFDTIFEDCFGANLAKTLKQYMAVLKDIERAEDDIAIAAPRVQTLENRARERDDRRTLTQLAAAKTKLDEASERFVSLQAKRRQILDMKLNLQSKTVSKN